MERFHFKISCSVMSKYGKNKSCNVEGVQWAASRHELYGGVCLESCCCKCVPLSGRLKGTFKAEPEPWIPTTRQHRQRLNTAHITWGVFFVQTRSRFLARKLTSARDYDGQRSLFHS